MLKQFIPWRSFLEELQKQPIKRRNEWLRWWVFSEDGVRLRQEAKYWLKRGDAQHANQHSDVFSVLNSEGRPRLLH